MKVLDDGELTWRGVHSSPPGENGKNEKKKKIKEKNIRSPGMCRLLVRHPCRSCHDRLPSHTLLLPLLVTHNLPLIYKVMGEGKL